MQNWDDEKESTLIRILFDLLPPEVCPTIERTSRRTNVRWSEAVYIARAPPSPVRTRSMTWRNSSAPSRCLRTVPS